MAKLYPDKRHGWRVVYYLYFLDGTRKRKHKFFGSKEPALLALQDIEKLETFSLKQILTHEEIVYFVHKKYIARDETEKLTTKPICTMYPQELRWDMLADVYYRHIKKVGSYTTRVSYPHKIKPVLNYFEKMPPYKVDNDEIDKYVSLRRETVSKATLNKEISALRIMLDHLVKMGLLKENPARNVKLFSNLPERLPRCLSPDELKKIFLHMQNYYACGGYFPEIVTTYLFTGLRRYELLSLKRHDIDFKRQSLRVIGKGDKERIIELHPMLIEKVFPSVIAKNGTRSGKYFFGGNDKPLMNENSLGRAFRIFLQRHKLYNENSLHTLRHTFISYMIDSGTNIKKMQEIAGHNNIKTTLKYTHIVPSSEPAIRKLNYDKYLPEDE